MQLVDMVEHVLQTGVLPMTVEREMQQLLKQAELDDVAMQAIEDLLNALTKGLIRPIA